MHPKTHWNRPETLGRSIKELAGARAGPLESNYGPALGIMAKVSGISGPKFCFERGHVGTLTAGETARIAKPRFLPNRSFDVFLDIGCK